MVRLDVITTRGGDAGETSLGDGSRLRKENFHAHTPFKKSFENHTCRAEAV